MGVWGWVFSHRKQKCFPVDVYLHTENILHAYSMSQSMQCMLLISFQIHTHAVHTGMYIRAYVYKRTHTLTCMHASVNAKTHTHTHLPFHSPWERLSPRMARNVHAASLNHAFRPSPGSVLAQHESRRGPIPVFSRRASFWLCNGCLC